MREVRLVGLADDGEHILLTGPELGTVTLRIDDRLKAAVLRDRRLLDQLQARPSSSLSVREIQARLRSGATAEEIADEAGVGVEAIRRFAGPVIDERQHVAEAVRKVTNRAGRALGEAVDPGSEWDAARREDGSWVVTATGIAGVAQFAWDPARRQLSPESELAALALAEPDELALPSVVAAPPPVALSLVREPATPTSTGAGEQTERTPPREPAPAPSPEPTPAPARRAGATDRQAEADGVAPGKRATVPSWDDILFGTRPPEH